MTPRPAPCGTRAAYRRGCRCRPCRAASAAARTAQRRRRVQRGSDGQTWAVEAQHWVQQLAGAGYSRARVARLAGWADGRAYHVTFRGGQRIRWQTFVRVRAAARACVTG